MPLYEKPRREIDAVSADLSAHRADAEAHHGGYRVREDDERFGE